MSTGFDAAAATAAYLATLPPQVRQAAAARTDAAIWLWGLDLLLMLAACWLMLRLDVLAKLKALVERKGERPRTATFVLCAVAAAGLVAVSTVAAAVAGAVSGQPAPPAPYGLWLIGAILVLPTVYVVAARAPKRWWLWLGATFTLFAVYLVWVPYVEASGPMAGPTVPQGPTRQAILTLARDSGLQVSDVYLTPSTRVGAEVTGMPGRPRITITEGMLKTLSPAEAKASVGHLVGHYVRQDQLKLGLTLGALGIAVLLAIQLLFAPVARLVGRPDLSLPDPRGLAIAAAIAIAAYALAGIVHHAVDRLADVSADRYALDHAREPDAMATALLRTDQDSRVDPSPLEQAVLYDRPALAGRIGQAMRWKAEHPLPSKP